MLLNVSDKLVNFSSLSWMVGAVWAFFALEGEDDLNFCEKKKRKLTSMIFIEQRPLVDNNQKALNKMSIIVDIKVSVEDAMWMKHSANVQFFESVTVKIEGI